MRGLLLAGFPAMSNPAEYHRGKFPPRILDWERLVPLIGAANAGLARYDGLLTAIPNASVLLSPLTTQEAVLSSRIEGTQATIGEVLEVEAGGQPPGFDESKRGDVEEILNYRLAMNQCVAGLETLPLSQRLVRQAHETLLQGVRGRNKDPGNYRRIENWIGPAGCSKDQSSFIPISPELLPDAMSRWEKYLHEPALDRLVQLAIAHVEFEAIHPFLDGNGRVGRMLIPLFLFEKKLLAGPNFYMSAFFEARREEYYLKLRKVSQTDDWSGWIEFFLQAVVQQAGENERKAREILALYNQVVKRVVDITRSQHAIRVTDFLFRTPIFQGSHFTARSGIPKKPTAHRILALLREHHIVDPLQENRGRVAGIFAFKDLLNIAEGRLIF